MKNLIKKKTFWAGVGQIVAGVGIILTGGSLPEAVMTISTGLGTIFMRHAVEKINQQ